MPQSDPYSMYVLNKHTYRDLLQLVPATWQIREQTLRQITQTLPAMTPLEFRRSLIYLADQARTGKQEIKNHNAWLKAAFQRNGGPLITELDIENQLEQKPSKTAQDRVLAADGQRDDQPTLRRYLAASDAERAEIDRMAEERVGRLLERVSVDNHAGIREQARIECAREFFDKTGGESVPTGEEGRGGE